MSRRDVMADEMPKRTLRWITCGGVAFIIGLALMAWAVIDAVMS